jgi:hypothetical protein
VRCARAIEKEKKNNQGLSPSIPGEIDKGVAAAVGLQRRNLPSTGAALGRRVVEGYGLRWGRSGWLYTEGEEVERRESRRISPLGNGCNGQNW